MSNTVGLSKEAIEEFRQIWKEESGKEISYEYAQERATDLINLFKVLLKPIPKQDLKKSINKNRIE